MAERSADRRGRLGRAVHPALLAVRAGPGVARHRHAGTSDTDRQHRSLWLSARPDAAADGWTSRRRDAPSRADAPRSRALIAWWLVGFVALAVVLLRHGSPLEYIGHLDRSATLNRGAFSIVAVALIMRFAALAWAAGSWSQGERMESRALVLAVTGTVLIGLTGGRLFVVVALADFLLLYVLLRRPMPTSPGRTLRRRNRRPHRVRRRHDQAPSRLQGRPPGHAGRPRRVRDAAGAGRAGVCVREQLLRRRSTDCNRRLGRSRPRVIGRRSAVAETLVTTPAQFRPTRHRSRAGPAPRVQSNRGLRLRNAASRDVVSCGRDSRDSARVACHRCVRGCARSAACLRLSAGRRSPSSWSRLSACPACYGPVFRPACSCWSTSQACGWSRAPACAHRRSGRGVAANSAATNLSALGASDLI